MKNNVEVEVKIAARSPSHVRALLEEHKFRIRSPRVLEHNVVLDTTDRSLYRSALLLRVRRAGRGVTCTFKGPESMTGRHKRRQEREFSASSFDECLAVFEGVGFRPCFRYEKFRTEYQRRGETGHVTLDETPMGVFMELEGPAGWIDRTAKMLGCSRADYIKLSYARLWRQWNEAMFPGKRRRTVSDLPDMIF